MIFELNWFFSKSVSFIKRRRKTQFLLFALIIWSCLECVIRWSWWCVSMQYYWIIDCLLSGHVIGTIINSPGKPQHQCIFSVWAIQIYLVCIGIWKMVLWHYILSVLFHWNPCFLFYVNLRRNERSMHSYILISDYAFRYQKNIDWK